VYAGDVPTTVDFYPYGAGKWGVNVASGDVDGMDAEILTGPGPGDVFGPHVRAFRRNGDPMSKIGYFAYGTLKYGVNVGAGWLDDDDYEEILNGPGPGAVFGPQVRGYNFDGASIATIAKINYFAYLTLAYGVNIASGRIDVDPYAEIVTAPGPGVQFGPQIRGWNFDCRTLETIAKVNFNAFTVAQYGANVASGDVDQDGFGEILAAPGPGAGPDYQSQFRGFDFDGVMLGPLSDFQVTAYLTHYGGRVGAGDINDDLRDELLTGAGRDLLADSTVKAFRYDGAKQVLVHSFVPFGTATYGVNTAGGSLGQ